MYIYVHVFSQQVHDKEKNKHTYQQWHCFLQVPTKIYLQHLEEIPIKTKSKSACTIDYLFMVF